MKTWPNRPTAIGPTAQCRRRPSPRPSRRCPPPLRRFAYTRSRCRPRPSRCGGRIARAAATAVAALVASAAVAKRFGGHAHGSHPAALGRGSGRVTNSAPPRRPPRRPEAPRGHVVGSAPGNPKDRPVHHRRRGPIGDQGRRRRQAPRAAFAGGEPEDKSDAAGKGVSPLLLVAVLALSVMMCMVLVLMPGGRTTRPAGPQGLRPPDHPRQVFFRPGPQEAVGAVSTSFPGGTGRLLAR